MGTCFIGTAGWSIPKQHAAAFPAAGSHLQRYASVLQGVEINSSFYRPHRPSTYERWASAVPPEFRFAAKLPREITHTRRLVDVDEPLRRFLQEVRALGPRLGPLLVQLPPSLSYEPGVVRRFLCRFREIFDGHVAFEPRHRTWFDGAADGLLAEFRAARVAADPAVVPAAAAPGGWQGLLYIRLHGSPDIYYSRYPAETIAATERRLASSSAVQSWCIFDNTAAGEAAGQALDLADLLRRSAPAAPSLDDPVTGPG